MKAIIITAIEWSVPVRDALSSGPILIGSSTGQLYELELAPIEKREEVYFAQVNLTTHEGLFNRRRDFWYTVETLSRRVLKRSHYGLV